MPFCRCSCWGCSIQPELGIDEKVSDRLCHSWRWYRCRCKRKERLWRNHQRWLIQVLLSISPVAFYFFVSLFCRYSFYFFLWMQSIETCPHLSSYRLFLFHPLFNISPFHHFHTHTHFPSSPYHSFIILSSCPCRVVPRTEGVSTTDLIQRILDPHDDTHFRGVKRSTCTAQRIAAFYGGRRDRKEWPTMLGELWLWVVIVVFVLCCFVLCCWLAIPWLFLLWCYYLTFVRLVLVCSFQLYWP